jgi:hypothetical protein
MKQMLAKSSSKSLGLVFLLVIFLGCEREAPSIRLTDGDFFVHDLGHRCLDFGAEAAWKVGGPVYIYSCNGTVAQQVRVKEIDSDTHDVQLMVQSRFCIGVRGGKMMLDEPLELQACGTNSPAQRFALDGDAILVGRQAAGDRVSREYVIAPKKETTNLTTPLVVSTRVVNDAEYFRFQPVSNPALKPTSGFVTVDSEPGLENALALGWGTVIEVDPAEPLVLNGPFPKFIHAGETIRGYRKYLSQGPQIVACTTQKVEAFEVSEDNVRITGLRLHGPLNSKCKDTSPPEAQAIEIDAYPQDETTATVNAPPEEPGCSAPTTYKNGRETGGCEHMPVVLLDHVDFSYFTGSAVDTRGQYIGVAGKCPTSVPFPRDTPVRVIGNLMTHSGAFGSVVGDGSFVLDQANVAYQLHAQAISSDPWPLSGFLAYDNFMLSDERKTASFDMHGSGDPGHWVGGISGDSDIGFNTALRTDYQAVSLRGTPCGIVKIHDNVFTQSRSVAIENHSTDPNKVDVYANSFGGSNPLAFLAKGDFDGDGVDDVFVGTGEGWYYSSGGQAEWRFLNRMTEKADTLLFGDLDGDGRTDVIALHGSSIDVSWAGISPWQTINTTPWPISNLAVGDFDGDGNADLFLATGTQWFYAPGGRNWEPMGPSVYETAQLLFGDFQHTGRTEAIRVHNGRWLVAGLNQEWTDIGATPPGVSSVVGLRVADFAGTGYADLVRSELSTANWEFTVPVGGPNWTTLRASTQPIAATVIGRFNGDPTSDVLTWSGRDFVYFPSGKDPQEPLSRQEMQ